MEKTQVQRVSVKTQEIDLKKSKGRRNNRSEKTHLNSEILVRLVMVLKFGSVKHLDLPSFDFKSFFQTYVVTLILWGSYSWNMSSFFILMSKLKLLSAPKFYYHLSCSFHTINYSVKVDNLTTYFFKELCFYFTFKWYLW